MNKVFLMGRLVKDPEVRYSQSAEPIAVARYTLAVNRRFKRQNEPTGGSSASPSRRGEAAQGEADFINCIAFGKSAEFAEKYFKKGQQVSITGRIQVRSWSDQEGKKHWSTEVIVEEQYFAEGKKTSESKPVDSNKSDGFYTIDEDIEEDDLPF